MSQKDKFKSNIWKIYAVYFFHGLMLFSAVSVPFFLDWGGLNYKSMFFLETFFLLSIIALEIPTGVIADKFGRKTSIALGCFVNAIAILFFSFEPNLVLFIIGEFVWALAVALISGADRALLYDTLKKMGKEKQSQRYFGRLESMFSLSIIIAAPVGSWIAQNYGLRYSMLLTAIPIFLAGVVSILLYEPKTRKKYDESKFFKQALKGFKLFRKNKTFGLLSLDKSIFLGFSWIIYYLFQSLLLNVGVDIIYLGFVVSAWNIIAVIVGNRIEFFDKHFNPRRLILLLGLLGGVFLVTLGLSRNVYVILPLLLLIPSIRIVRSASLENQINKHIESKDRATILSTVSMMESLLQAISYLIAGFLADVSLYITLIILGIIIFSSAVFSRVKEE